MMKRDECLRVLAHHVTDEIVVATYQAAFDWLVIRPHPLNYVSIGAMGIASSHALGLALGRPDKRVLVLDGDGSLLIISAAWSASSKRHRATSCISSARTAPMKRTARIPFRAATE